MTIKSSPSDADFDKAIEAYEAAVTLNTGVTPPMVTHRDGLVFIGNDATGLTLKQLRDMTTKLWEGI